jgi:HEAT repeat protein
MKALALLVLAASSPGADRTRPISPAREFHDKVKELAESLTNNEASVKARAEQQLLAMGPPATEQLLATAVLTRDSQQKEAIENLLPRFGPSAVERLFWGPGWQVRVYRGASGVEDPIRDTAVNAVVRMGAPALPEIRRLLEDPSERGLALGGDSLRLSAMTALNRMGPLGTEIVVDFLLRHPEKEMRWSMASILANAKNPDPRGADGLLQALNDTNITVRGYAADGLGRLRDRRAIDRLVEMLRTDPGPQTRMAAGAALGRIYEPRLFAPLSRAAQWDRDWDVRKTASNVLMHWTYDPVAMRVGRRYYPPKMTLEYIDFVRAAYMLVLVVTGMLVYVAIWSATRTTAIRNWRGVPDSVLNQSLAVMLLGFAWAFWMRLVWGWIELSLLLAVVPITALLAWRTGARLKSLRGSLIGCATGFVLAFLAPIGGIWIGLGLMFLAFWSMVAIVGTSLLIGLLRKRSPETSSPTPVRTASLACAGAFYAGYGVGWLALWGYLGF